MHRLYQTAFHKLISTWLISHGCERATEIRKLVHESQIGISRNRYVYARSNPTRFIDPSSLVASFPSRKCGSPRLREKATASDESGAMRKMCGTPNQCVAQLCG